MKALLITVVSFFVLSNMVFSSDAADLNQSNTVAVQDHGDSSKAKPSDGASYYMTAVTVGFALAFAAMFGALGQAKAISSAVEAIARQPEAGGRIFISMLLGVVFIETLVIYTLVISFLLMGKLA
jgi:F0F1-type ATP synthase membrane subunit c/vacuolar-type H+-ATPase subunit K